MMHLGSKYVLESLPVFLVCMYLFTWNAHAQLQAGDYIIKVSSECPQYSNGTARVQVLTDVPDAYPFAICYDDWVYDMVQVDAGTWTQDVVFTTAEEWNVCMFNRKQSSNTYVIHVFVPLTSGLILGDEPPHVITCTYDDHSVFNSSHSQFEDSKKPIEELLQNMGPVSKSNVDLYVADVSGNKLTGRIRIGRTIRLHAKLIGDFPDEVSFQAVSCKAVGPLGNYNILIGGCGDDSVLSRGSGFITSGKEAISPYFRSFRMPRSRTLTFDCTFVICKSNCDGSSCSLERKKRAIGNDSMMYIDQSVHVRSPRIILPPDMSVKFNSDLLQRNYTSENLREFNEPNTMIYKSKKFLDEIEQTFMLMAAVPMALLLLAMVIFIFAISRVINFMTRIRSDLDTHRKQYLLSVHAKTASDI